MSSANLQKSTTQSTMLDVALSHVAAGRPVFPCRHEDDFDAATGEVLPEKAPLISNGLRGATRNERVVRELWKRNPDAIVGIPTGERIGAWVLDIDVRPEKGKDGRVWLSEMEATHGALPETLRVATANGGEHIYFKYVAGVRNRGKLGAGIDVRGEGGFVVASGSVMGDGRFYDVTFDAPIADAPDWLLDLVLPPPITHYAGDYSYQPSGAHAAYVERAMDAELRELAGTATGGRGYQLNASAFSLGQLVGAGVLDRAEAEHGLWAAAQACGVAHKDGERETRAKIRRGLDAGERQPRRLPEAQPDNDNTRLVDISRMIANGLAKAAQKQEKPAEAKRPEPKGESPAEPESQTTPESPIIATPFTWIDPKTLPRREFAYGTHLIRKFVSVTSSPGGLGKTSLSIAEALAMATGRPLLGIKPPKPIRVWLFNAEDPRDEMERRIMAACLHYNIKPDDIAGRLFLDTGREQELVIAIDDKRGVKIQVPIVEAVVEQVKRNRIDVMYIDPFVSTHQVNENDNGAIDKVAKLWAKIADETNIAIDVVHHLRKGRDDKESTVEDSRGAVALLSAARSARVLNRMSAEQATQAGVLPKDRFSYFSVHQGKANLTQMSDALDWRKLVSVPLGNGRGLTKPQDHAGVVTEWRWPGSEEIANGLTADQLAHIKTLVDNGDYKEGPRAKNWVGLAVAYALGLDLEEDGTRKRAATILKALMKEGELVKSEEKDPVRRETAVFVRSNAYKSN